MIVQVTGTNGSGKTTVVRRILEKAVSRRGREIWLPGLARCACVVGDYDGAPTGGCDGLKPDEAYRQVAAAAAQFAHVIFEGIFVMNQTRGPQLVQELGRPFLVLALTTPLGVCIDSITRRRSNRGAADLRYLRNVEGNYTRAQNYASRMREAGAWVVRCSREDAPGRIMDILRRGSI